MNPVFDSRPKTVAFAVMVLCPIAFIVSLPWLKDQPVGVVQLFGGLAATGTVVASFVLAVLKDKDLDEWQRGAARFSNQWGWLAGGGVVAILQVLPAFQSLVISLTKNMVAQGSSIDTSVIFAFMLGFMAVILAQMLCIVVLSKSWRSWMSREMS